MFRLEVLEKLMVIVCPVMVSWCSTLADEWSKVIALQTTSPSLAGSGSCKERVLGQTRILSALFGVAKAYGLEVRLLSASRLVAYRRRLGKEGKSFRVVE